jgi:hypothetical protein
LVSLVSSNGVFPVDCQCHFRPIQQLARNHPGHWRLFVD